MCKSEYKLTRKMQWDGDVLKVQDTMHDVLREAKQAMTDAMTGEVLNHFECDFSDFREYMHDKINWEQKQWAAMPKWIPVTERLPENGKYVLAYSADDDYTTIEARHKFEVFQITHWMPLPEPPKEEKDG